MFVGVEERTAAGKTFFHTFHQEKSKLKVFLTTLLGFVEEYNVEGEKSCSGYSIET